MKKKAIMFLACGGTEWIAGLYYVKNVVYALTKSEAAMREYNIYIYIDKENKHIFNMFDRYPNITFLYRKVNLITKIFNRSFRILFNRYFNFQIIKYTVKYNIKKIFPMYIPFFLVKNRCIYWIPDFQHTHLKELFSQKEINFRNHSFQRAAKDRNTLILSSNDVYNDFKKLYPSYTDHVHVVPFISAIDDNVLKIQNVSETLNKYGISEPYFYVPNQFHKHKNHLIALKALKLFIDKYYGKVQLVFTGNTKGTSSSGYFHELQKYIEVNNLLDKVVILGFLNREEQIALFKGAVAIIQPSLFEGWSTVVEDAKALKKNVILSDLDVHLEQKNEDCYIFSRHDENSLCDMMRLLLKMDQENNTEKYSIHLGMEYVNSKAKEYGDKIYNIFNA